MKKEAIIVHAFATTVHYHRRAHDGEDSGRHHVVVVDPGIEHYYILKQPQANGERQRAVFPLMGNLRAGP